ncbi:hemolysin secretion protein D, partial [Budviciaceae bacterium CWB-B4]|nr:hemolysin secretion protein D [Limnobaculum xujianqingii]MBK5178459.1 hemolysin secretion protein D [Limnobaculum xujianqingii]
MTDKIQKVGGGSLSVAKAPAPTGKVKSSDLPFMRDLQEALIEQKTPFSLI